MSVLLGADPRDSSGQSLHYRMITSLRHRNVQLARITWTPRLEANNRESRFNKSVKAPLRTLLIIHREER
jgi:hypothetical protein